MRRVAVRGDVARADLALSLALGHTTSLACGEKIDPPAHGVDPSDAHRDLLSEAQRRTGALAAQDRGLLVELPPLADALSLSLARAPLLAATSLAGAPAVARGGSL